jgi:hypothetical protein
MMYKHLVSVLDILKDAERGKFPTNVQVEEKFTDLINYLLLAEGLLIDQWRESNTKVVQDCPA